jgi:hypothetical protein
MVAVKGTELVICLVSTHAIAVSTIRGGRDRHFPYLETFLNATRWPRPPLTIPLPHRLFLDPLGCKPNCIGVTVEGNCSIGDIGCVTNAVDVRSDTSSTYECPTSTLVDAHYLLTNTREKNVDLSRVTVIAMPCRGDRPTTRRANAEPKLSPAAQQGSLIPDYETFTPIGESGPSPMRNRVPCTERIHFYIDKAG